VWFDYPSEHAEVLCQMDASDFPESIVAEDHIKATNWKLDQIGKVLNTAIDLVSIVALLDLPVQETVPIATLDRLVCVNVSVHLREVELRQQIHHLVFGVDHEACLAGVAVFEGGHERHQE